MNPFESQSVSARRYLDDLSGALVAAPPTVRDDIVAGVAEELRGLDDSAAETRISALGDPRAIAADAMDELGAPEVPTRPSGGYAIGTVVVLVAGWYVVPVVGWIVGLGMIFAGSHWSSRVRLRGILLSLAVVIVSTLLLVAFRGSALSLVGLALFAVGPLVGNLFVGAYLRKRWGGIPIAQ